MYREGDAAGDFYIIMEGKFLVEKMVDINPKVKKKAKTMQKFKSLRRVKSDKNKRKLKITLLHKGQIFGIDELF